MNSFDLIWERIIAHQGEVFYTKRRLPFTFKVEGDKVIPNRTDYSLEKKDFEIAASLGKLTGPGKMRNNVYGSSYIYAIMTDKRIID